MTWLLIIFIVLSIFYLLIVLLTVIGLRRLKSVTLHEQQPFVSIVIAARNEESRLQPLFASLAQLDYPKDKYEVLFVDDASTDRTATIIAEQVKKNERWKLLRRQTVSDRFHAKKMALAKGIAEAKGDFIFTTDADCSVPRKWLKNMTRYFGPRTSMVLGFSPLKNTTGFLDKWLKFDNLFSGIVAAAPTMLGFPISSVGRNMAFRKEAYLSVGGYASLTKFRSGDDIHLTERMRDKVRGEIIYCADPRTFVLTQPPDSGKEIFHQQVRKNSKILDKSLKSAVFSILLFFAYLLFFTLPLFNGAWLNLWLGVLVLKFFAEFLALMMACRIFENKELIPLLPLMQLFYPFYVIFFGLLGSLHLYSWKK